MKTTAKTISVCVLGNNPVMLAMKRVTDLVDVEFVETATEADLVVAESVREIESGFSKDKYYAIITVEKVNTEQPDNVFVFRAPFALVNYYKLISDISERLAAKPKTKGAEEAEGETPLLPDAKSILVIDDTADNIASARKLLAGHKLSVADGYESAMEFLGREKFEIVLADLYLPMSSRTLSEKAFKLGELVPYGFMLMCEAARNGAEYVAIVTDLGHHDDHFSAAFDHFSRFTLKIENAKVKMLHAYKMENGAKDWKNALDRLMRD